MDAGHGDTSPALRHRIDVDVGHFPRRSHAPRQIPAAAVAELAPGLATEEEGSVRQVRLDQTDLRVSAIAFGTWAWPGVA
jgi:hypothetical protein